MAIRGNTRRNVGGNVRIDLGSGQTTIFLHTYMVYTRQLCTVFVRRKSKIRKVVPQPAILIHVLHIRMSHFYTVCPQNVSTSEGLVLPLGLR